MKKILLLSVVVLLLCSSEIPVKDKTFCNPMNLNYRFQASNTVSYREAADPALMRYKDKYILFVSHSGGYWYSDDMMNWKYLPIKTLPIEEYAPDAITINDTTYYAFSSNAKQPLYYTTNPLTDSWKAMDKPLSVAIWDPNFFRDEDGKVYLYWGCSNTAPIYGVRLGAKMQPVTEPAVFIEHNHQKYGWEVPGDANELARNGYNEGAWMTKFKNKYYLQYAAPGTEFKTYADGVYTSESPLGPFKYETYSPFSYKPGGFMAGAGHSTTFQDKYGNYWHISSMTISIRHMFERRLGLFPAAFDKDGVFRVFTAFGDYPTKMADHKIDFEKEDLFKGWMLLSYKKSVEASSSLDKFPATNAVDEETRTWWSANTGNPGEWFKVQLDDKTTVNAIQVNFADNDSKLKIESKDIYYQYRILGSNDGKKWDVIVDKSKNTIDACHDYIELEKPVKTKYIKIENVRVPDGKFSIYDLRIFGKKAGKVPASISDFKVERNESDTRKAKVEWKKDELATGYVVNYGTDPGKLYSSFMVYEANSINLTALNKDVTYYYSINSFNESGITKGSKVIKK